MPRFAFTRLRLCLMLLCMVVSSIAFSRPALAEPSAADRATARDLAREGFEALKRDDFTSAEDRFRRADALVHAPTLVVDHARSLVGLGRLVEAHERYSLVLREGVSPNAAWPWKRAYADAQKEIEVIKDRLAWLTINVVGPSAPEVSIDGKAIPAAAVGVRRATDPGERQIVAGGAGYESKTETVVLGEGDEQTIDLKLEALPEEEQPDAAPETPAPQAQPNDSAGQAPAKDNLLAYIALGVGGAGLATWGVTGALFFKEQSNLNDNCTNHSCYPDQADSKNNYDTLGWVSGIAGGIGIAGVAGGLYLLLTDNEPSSSPTESARVVPYVSPTGLGVSDQF